MISRIHKELNVKIPLAELFKIPTIIGLSGYIQNASQEQFASISPVEKIDFYPLSSAQKRLYILQQIDIGSTAYNMPEIIPLLQEPDMEKMGKVVIQLIQRHESLRTSFHIIADEPVQIIHDEVEFKIEYYDIDNRQQAIGNSEEEMPNAYCLMPESVIKDFIRHFDLLHAPLLRVGLLKTKETKNLFMVDMHHIISDGISRVLLVQEFMAL
jgi:hypothetical protein